MKICSARREKCLPDTMSNKALIGVRYCGGCNSRYDRVAVVNKLKSLMPEAVFENVAPNMRYEAIVVVNGCDSRCAKTDDLIIPAGRMLSITGWKDLLPVRNQLQEILAVEEGISLTHEEVLALLPQRAPMLFIDEVSQLKPGIEVKASFLVREDLPEFEGHFPGNPVFPGVHSVEAMAQAADIMLLSLPHNRGKEPLFGKINEARFRKQIRPGDCLEIHASLMEEQKIPGWNKCRCQILVEEELAADAEIVIIMKSIGEDI